MTAEDRVQGVGCWEFITALDIGGITGPGLERNDSTVTILAACEDNAHMAKMSRNTKKVLLPFQRLLYLDPSGKLRTLQRF